eukprot:1328322-Amphidinium_carterae.1
MREAGGLCAPSFPTHTGRDEAPFLEVYPQLAEVTRLVDEAYDSSLSSDGEVPVVMEDDIIDIGSSLSSTSSLYVLSEDDPSSGAEHWSVDDSSASSSSLRLVAGGGKFRRVQHEAIATAATERMIGDLGLPQGLMVEHKCATRVIRSDAHAAKAICQAQTIKQRYLAFSAALSVQV